jgi:hypothetical protein
VGDLVSDPKGADQTGTLVVAAGLAALIGLLTLAEPVGRLLEPAPLDFWPEVVHGGRIAREPTEVARFLFAAATPVVIAALILLGPHRWGLRRAISTRAAGTIGAVTGLVLLGVGWIVRDEPERYVYGLDPEYFSELDLIAAVLLAAAVAALALSPRSQERVTDFLARARRPRRAQTALGLVVVVVLSTLLWAAPAAYPGNTLRAAPGRTAGHLPFTGSDFAAFGNGLTPLVDFASQYSNVFPWLLHPVFSAFEYSSGSFTVTMAALTVVTMLAVWRALAIATGNEWIGALVYVPVLALSIRPTIEVGDERVSNASLVQIMPERYLLPFIVAWLCVRHVRGRRPRAPFILFLVGGVALLNNPEFGAPCLLATFGALLIASEGPIPRQLLRLCAHLIGGVVVAGVLVTALTLLRTGALPDPALLTYFSRFFVSQGFNLQPMPVLGLHLVIYVTMASALIVAAIRRRAADTAPPFVALLAYAGIFGLAAGGYYVGRSNATTMVGVFPAWGLAVALLAWSTFTWLLRLDHPRQAINPVGAFALCALVGVGLAASDLVDAPSPSTQVRRLTADIDKPSPFFALGEAERFVERRTEPGEPVVILRANGHLIAREAGVRNVATIGHPFHVVSTIQLNWQLRRLRAEGGDKVFVGDSLGHPTYASLPETLHERGWRPVRNDRPSGMVEWQQQ